MQSLDLYLKGLEKKDLADRHRWLNDAEITKYFTNLGAMPLSFEKLLQWYHNLTDNEMELHFSIFLKDHRHIGGAQLKMIDWKNRSAEFGMFIGEKIHWGKGLGAQITRILVNYAFTTLNLHRLWLRVDPENLAAIKCYQKAGFVHEGIFRQEVFRNNTYHDSWIMSLLQSEWKNSPE